MNILELFMEMLENEDTKINKLDLFSIMFEIYSSTLTSLKGVINIENYDDVIYNIYTQVLDSKPKSINVFVNRVIVKLKENFNISFEYIENNKRELLSIFRKVNKNLDKREVDYRSKIGYYLTIRSFINQMAKNINEIFEIDGTNINGIIIDYIYTNIDKILSGDVDAIIIYERLTSAVNRCLDLMILRNEIDLGKYIYNYDNISYDEKIAALISLKYSISLKDKSIKLNNQLINEVQCMLNSDMEYAKMIMEVMNINISGVTLVFNSKS